LRIPFTVDEFFDVFTAYNHAVWPAQYFLLALAAVALALLYVRAENGSRIISWILVVMWCWTGLVYHIMHFTSINQAAWLFGLLFLIQAVVFAWYGGFRDRLLLQRPSGVDSIIGWILIVYGLIIYPVLGRMAGHPYMSSPTFGTPCPSTIFTFGLLWFARRPFPRIILVIPLLWTVIGGSAAIMLSVHQDFGLIAAGILGITLLVVTSFAAKARQDSQRASDSTLGG
jgi:hypothetical protein